MCLENEFELIFQSVSLGILHILKFILNQKLRFEDCTLRLFSPKF